MNVWMHVDVDVYPTGRMGWRFLTVLHIILHRIMCEVTLSRAIYTGYSFHTVTSCLPMSLCGSYLLSFWLIRSTCVRLCSSLFARQLPDNPHLAIRFYWFIALFLWVFSLIIISVWFLCSFIYVGLLTIMLLLAGTFYWFTTLGFN